MIEHFVGEREARVLRASPLGAHLDAFAAELVKAGYCRFVGQIRLRVLKDLGSWLGTRRRDVADLDEKLVETYLKERRRKCRHGSRRGVRTFLELLRRDHVVAPAVVAEGSEADQLRLRYETYLQRERGLVPATIDGYRPFVRRFLDEHPRASLHALGPADVSRFLLQCAKEMSRARAKLLSGLHDRLDLGVAVDVRGLTAISPGEQSKRRDLGAWLGGTPPRCEQTNRRQANVVFVQADGTRIAGRIAVAAPVVRAQDCACEVVMEGLERSHTILGDSTLQALLLGVRFLGMRLHDHQSRGLRIELDAGDDGPDEGTSDDVITVLFGPLLRAASPADSPG